MADPREDLVDPILSNEPGFIRPPNEPFRLTVRPLGVSPPPVNDVNPGEAWGAPNEAGRPSGRLFEPDLSPAPSPTAFGEFSRVNKMGSQPLFLGSESYLADAARGIGSLVQGAADWFGSRDTPQRQPAAPGAQPGMRSSISGLPPRHAPPPSPDGLTPAGRAVGEVLQSPQRFIESGQGYYAPESMPGEREARARAQVERAADVGMNVAGFGMTGASLRGGSSIGTFGGRMMKGWDPNKEKLAELMEQNGQTPQQIWKDTGLVKFADGKWTTEISDLGARYIGDFDSVAGRIFDQKYPDRAGQYNQAGSGNGIRTQYAKQEALLYFQNNPKRVLKDVLHHPVAYDAYEKYNLHLIPVEHDPTMVAQGAYYPRSAENPLGKIVYREEGQIDPKTGKFASRGDTLDTLLHEAMGHAVSNIEGFAKGTNPTAPIPLGHPARKFFDAEVAKGPSVLSFEEYKKLYAARGETRTKEQYESYKAKAEIDQYQFEKQAMRIAGRKNYEYSSGEANANLIIDRKDLTPEQAAAIYPPSGFHTPMKDQTVEFNEPFSPGQAQEAIYPGYHGSPRGDLTSISASPGSRQFDNATSQFGAFFAPNEGGAKRYMGKDGKIYSVNLDLKKPYEMPVGEFLRFQAPNKGAKGQRIPPEQWAARAEELKQEAAVHRAQLEAAGHDGVIIRRSDGTIMEMASFKDVPVAPEAQMSVRPKLGSLYSPTGLAADRQAAGYSNVKGGTPVSGMNWRIQHGPPTETRTSMPIDKALQPGDEIIPIVGDDTRKLQQGYVTEIGGQPVTPVLQQGGFDFALGQPVDPRTGLRDVWGNAQGAATQIDKLARAAEARGNRPVIMSTTMGKTGGDFSNQFYRPTLELLKRNPPSGKLIEELDTFMRTKNTAGPAFTEAQFPGFGSENIWDVLDKAGGNMRSKLMKALDRKSVVAAGGPDIGLIRVANANPALYNTPAGHMGYHIANVAPGQTGAAAHSVYPIATRGSDVRGFGGSVPAELVLRDLDAGLRKMYELTGSKEYLNRMDYYAIRPPNAAAEKLGLKPLSKTQVVDAELIDKISEYVRKNGLKTLPPAIAAIYLANQGGEAKAAPIGSLVDPSRYNAQ